MFYVVVRFILIVLLKILCRLQAFGQYNIPLRGGFILASNHASYLDPPVVGAACPRVLFFLAKEELFKNAVFGWLLSNLNTFPIQRQSGDFKSLRQAIRHLRQGKALAIFPEGTRTAEGKLAEPMRGIGLLAVKAGASIVPAFIEGSNKALPIHSKFIRPKKIKIYFGKAIWPQKFRAQLNKRDFYRLIAEKTMEEIRRLKEENINF